MKSILISGKSADDIGIQSGGWTITWQGEAGNVTRGTTILQGIKNIVSTDVKICYNKNGVATGDYNAAIVVIGETPYAEEDGDKSADELTLDAIDITTINNIKHGHPNTPIVAVLVSGRPLTIADQIHNLDGIVEAWIPGTEGNGIADVLFGNYDFTGKLPITWPWYAKDIVNKLDPLRARNLFNFGYGLKKGNDTQTDEFLADPIGGASTLSLGSILLTSVKFPLSGITGCDSRQTYATISTTAINHVSLKAGKQTLIFKTTAGGFNFSWMKLTKVIPIQS